MSIVVRAEKLEEGLWFAVSDDAPGCWADGATEQDALDEFCEVFRSWYQLKSDDGDDDLPGTDLTFSKAQP
jgi:predicted RNase H-like HicB family nuclease